MLDEHVIMDYQTASHLYITLSECPQFPDRLEMVLGLILVTLGSMEMLGILGIKHGLKGSSMLADVLDSWQQTQS